MGKTIQQMGKELAEARRTIAALNLRVTQVSAGLSRREEEVAMAQAEIRSVQRDGDARLKAAETRYRGEINALRDALHDSEIAYAKLTGYLDCVTDNMPARMVAEEREPRHHAYPIPGSQRFEFGERAAPWFHQ